MTIDMSKLKVGDVLLLVGNKVRSIEKIVERTPNCHHINLSDGYCYTFDDCGRFVGGYEHDRRSIAKVTDYKFIPPVKDENFRTIHNKILDVLIEIHGWVQQGFPDLHPYSDKKDLSSNVERGIRSVMTASTDMIFNLLSRLYILNAKHKKINLCYPFNNSCFEWEEEFMSGTFFKNEARLNFLEWISNNHKELREDDC